MFMMCETIHHHTHTIWISKIFPTNKRTNKPTNQHPQPTTTMSFEVAKRLVRNGLAVLTGLAAGSAANMGLILLNTTLFPMPPGVSFDDAPAFAAYIQDLPSSAYVLVFAAHYAQAVLGGYIAARLACCRHAAVATCYLVAALTGMGAVMNLRTLPVPAWTWMELAAYPVLAYYTAQLALQAMPEDDNKEKDS